MLDVHRRSAMNRTLWICLAASSGCLSMSDAEQANSPLVPTNLEQFQPRLREVAGAYEAYARVDDELHWAPGLCRQPQPSHPRLSASGDVDTHGRKLYYVFAAD